MLPQVVLQAVLRAVPCRKPHCLRENSERRATDVGVRSASRFRVCCLRDIELFICDRIRRQVETEYHLGVYSEVSDLSHLGLQGILKDSKNY